MSDTETETNGAETNGVPEIIRDPNVDSEDMRKIFVGTIAQEVKDDAFKTFFEEKSGGVVQEFVILRKGTKYNIGFVTFETSDLVDEVLSKRTELSLGGQTLDVKRAVPKSLQENGGKERTKKLFMANVPRTGCLAEEIKKYLEARHTNKLGYIESVELVKKKDESGSESEENKGFGFIKTSTEDLADKIAIQNASFEFGGRKIEVKKSVPTTGERGRGGMFGRGSRGGRGGSRGGGQQYGKYPDSGGAGYGGYGGWDDGWGGYGQHGAGYDYYGGYGGGYQSGGRGRGRGRAQRGYQPY